MAKPVVPSRRALRDIDSAWSHYLNEAGTPVALGFLDALDSAVELVRVEPGIGSPRWAQELNVPGLRSRRLKGYPYLIFYLEQDDAVDMVRLLHGAADILAAFGEAAQE